MPLDDRLVRPLPLNHDAEIGVLGAILASNRAYDAVADFLRPEHFADARHGLIYEAAAKIIAAGASVDAVTLKDHFAATGSLEQLGGAEYLARVQAACLTPILAESYGRTVHDRAMRRRAIDVAAQLSESAYSVQFDETAEGIVGRAQAELGALLTEAVATGPVSISQATQRALAAAERAYQDGTGIVGVPTLLTALDDVLGGLRAGTMTVIGARPHMGKSDLALNIAARNAANGLRVAFFQLEMTAEELAARVVARITGHPAGLILRGKFQQPQFNRMFEAQQAIEAWPLFIDDTPRLAVAQIQARAKSLEPDLVIVDHLGLIPSDVPGAAYRGKVEQTAAVSGALKAMAKNLRCPVIALCQLNREVEKRQDNHRPNLADLRWAGEIEQDADAVLFLYRASYYLDQTPKDERDTEWRQADEKTRGIAEVIVAKNRMGTTQTVRVAYQPARSLFGDIESDEPQHAQGAMF